MIQKSNLKVLLIILLLIPLLFSCMPEVTKETVKYEPTVTPVLGLSSDIIDQRISMLEGLLNSEDISYIDREDALSLLSDYRKIRSIIREGISENDYGDIINILFRNLDRFDDKYFLGKRGLEEQVYLNAVNELSIKRQKIQESYLSGDYQNVISGCIELETAFGPDSLTPDIGLIFAMSLAKTNRLKEAIDMGERIARELEGKPGLIDLRAGIIDWLLALGNDEKALEDYAKLVDNINEKSALFNKIRNSITVEKEDIDQFGSFAVDDYLPELSELAEPERSKELLNEVDRLIKNKDYTEARLTLLRWRLRVEEGPEEDIIEKALKAVDLAEKSLNDSSPESENEALENAKKLIEEERYEEAINSLDILREVHGDSRELSRFENLAVEKIIARERDKAAKIFLQSKNINDPKRKEALLISSFNILKKLIEKYPSSALINRLNDNLDMVRDELEKLRAKAE